MVTLAEWLNSAKDYETGLILLAKHSKNRVLIQNLNRKQNPGKLEYELRKIARIERIDIKPKNIKRKITPKKNQGRSGKNKKTESHSDQVIDRMNAELMASREVGKFIIVRNKREFSYDVLPANIQKLWDANRDAYKEIRALHEKLKLMEKATPADRAPLTQRIADLDDLIRSNWKVIDAWHPGQDPIKKTPEKPIDHKRINTNRKYISTNLKKLAEETNLVKAEKLRGKIQERVNELAAAGENMKEKTLEELKKLGIKC